MSTAEVMQSSPKLTSQQLRKIKKPIIEKRRRERINESLNQLKTLVLEALEKDESQYNKMEKADILEMTVKHLKYLQSRLSSTKNLLNSQSSNTSSVIVNKYKAGFKECAEEVTRYLNSVPAVHPGVKEHLSGHLTSCSSQLESCTPQVRDLQADHFHEGHSSDSVCDAATEKKQSVPVAGVQIGIPVVNGNGSSPLILSSPVSPIHPQGYLPILISPSGGSVGSGISVISPQHLSQSSAVHGNGGVIPLYSSGHFHSGMKSPLHDSDSSVYSSPRSTPPCSPVSHDDGSQYAMPLNCSYTKASEPRHNVTMTTPQGRLPPQCFKKALINESLGGDMFKYSKEMLIQPSTGPVWRPW